MVASDVDLAKIPAHVIHAGGDSLADVQVAKVVNGDPLRLAGRLPLSAAGDVLADQFLFLRIHRDNRIPRGDVASAGHVEVAELGVVVGVLLAFKRLGGGLEPIAEMVEHPPDDVIARSQPPFLQCLGQTASALAGSPQWGHRIAASLGGDQLLQGLE
jgi:hypothetical protein